MLGDCSRVSASARVASSTEDEVVVKQIEAIVRPEKLEDVKRALVDLGHSGLNVMRVKGHGTQGGIRQKWRGKEYVVDLLPKARLVTVLADEDVGPALHAIVSAAWTGRMGDGKIFVSSVENAFRVRTGESGVDALHGPTDLRSFPHKRLIDEEAS